MIIEDSNCIGKQHLELRQSQMCMLLVHTVEFLIVDTYHVFLLPLLCLPEVQLLYNGQEVLSVFI